MNLRISLGLGAAIFCAGLETLRADSVVVFNEIMYHPPTNEAVMEWVELHNQMAVDVDMSGWYIDGGIHYTFAEGTVIPGEGYLVLSISPADLMATTGLTNVFGPFTGRLGNNGDTLQLYNNNQRLMDTMTYGVDGDWPVAPDGSGVSLAKRDEDAGSSFPQSWTVSALVGGSPGRRNFPLSPFEITNSTPLHLSSTWTYDASGNDLGVAWQQAGFDDSAWSSGAGLFRAGTVAPPLGDPEPVATVFNSGVADNRTVLAPGTPDPHYLLTLSAQGTPPPPPIPATVIQNHPAWLANDAVSSWIGPVNPGTANVAAGPYTYRTSFSFDGYILSSALLKMNVGVDNGLTNVLLNGVGQGISYAGFSGLSGDFVITNGLLPGTNTLDFLTGNYGPGANPGGFRVNLTGLARKNLAILTTLPTGPTTYYFRTTFPVNGLPQQTTLKLDTLLSDGAIFYLNGAEVMRLNMPAGPVTASTLALSSVTNPTSQGPFLLPTASLLSGTNVLAVEVHQGPGGSSNALFGADLSVTTTNILVPPPVTLAFNEVSAAPSASFWLELINYGSSDLDLTGCVLASLGGATNGQYVLPAQTLGPGELLQVTQATLGFEVGSSNVLLLYGPGRGSVLDAVVAKADPRGRWPDGTGQWWHPTALTPGASNSFAFHKEVVINEIMYNAPGLPAVSATYATNVYVTITNLWKCSSLGQDLGTAWRTPSYDDSAWPAGPSLFYSGTAALPAPTNTWLPLSTGSGPIQTWYFRTEFAFNGDTNGLLLNLHPVVDAGAVFYLNGVECYRLYMPTGAITYASKATQWSPGRYTGPYPISATNLVAGLNVLAVEVHRFATNFLHMSFGTELLATTQLTPALPARASPESWLELFNRGSNSVDLTGWSLSGDIAYNFAGGTTLPAGGYLVVAQDVGYMQTNYPGLTVLGPFAGKLKHSSSHLLLLDPAGNPANEVTYYNGKPWPGYPAGGGSSLELRDPWADNSKAEAWAASLEGGRSSWNSYTYRGVASNLLGPTQWNEFLLGLLDAGECLIDDLSVVESPSGTPIQMLQNGTFETGLTAWRVLGTHSHSRVEVDPDNPANHVLHLITTGWDYHVLDHLETTYANNRVVTDGKEYQISFRAKWLAGNPRLNTHLYFNRLARTTVLPMPIQHGTPGAPNSTYATNIGPTFAALSHSPLVPTPTDAVTVRVAASDPQGVGAVTLLYSTSPGAWSTTPMSSAAGPAPPGYANYQALLPPQPAGTVVQFFVQAADGLGAVAAYPAGGTNSRALYKVDAGQALMTQLHRVRLIMTPTDADALHAHTNVMSYDERPLTVVYDERTVFYDADIHLQSSERGRDDPSRVGFSVKFHTDQHFRGNEHTITIDRSGGYSGLGGRHDEILLWHAASHAAGGLLGLNCDLLQVFAPRSQEDSTGMMRISAFDSIYFDGQFKNGGNGNLYKLELIYYPTTTVNGDPQAPKLPQPDNVMDVEFQDRGDDKENYRWVFLQENNADADDYSQIVALNKAMSLNGSALETQVNQLMDVDEYMRTLAFLAFIGAGDIYTYGLNHNWKVYIRPEDGKALGLLWDMDYEFVQPINYAFPGSGSANTYKLVTVPNNYRRYYNHLLDLMTTTINAAHLRPWAAHYAGLLGQDWSGAVNYLQQRADYIRSTLPLTTPFAITNHSGNNFAVSNSTVALAGTAPLTVKYIEVNGVRYPLTWLSLTSWTVPVPLPGYTNALIVQGVDNYGNRLTNATDSIVVTNLGPRALVPVVINEWMANNVSPSGFPDPADGHFKDWFELYNPNNAPVNLSGYYLTDTLTQPTLWAIPSNTVIAALGYRLVWADKLTNLNTLSTSGDLHANFKLSKSGSAIGLSAPDGTPLQSVVFGTQFPNVSQGLFPDGNTNAPYFMTNWTPRASNRLGDPASPSLSGVVLQPNGAVSFNFTTTPSRTYRVEYKDDFSAPVWAYLADVRADAASTTFTDNPAGPGQRFYRVVLVQ